MAYDEGLATRVRDVLGEQSGVTEKTMFGGLAFLVDGNMACGVRGGDLIVWTPTGTLRTTTCAAGSTGASPTPTRCRPSNHASPV